MHLCSSARRVSRESPASILGLNRAEALELFRLHANLATEANLPSRTLDKANTVGIHRLVDRSSTGLGASQRNMTSLGLGDGLGSKTLVTFAKVFDDRGLHGELHPVEGYEPDDILKRLRLAIENY